MKKITLGLTAFFLSLSMLGMLFKVMHWPGANIGLVIGIAGLALIAIPLIAINKSKASA